MDDWIGAVSQARRFAAQLLAAFAGVALLLAALGVHGIVSIAVTARRRELGVRRALGATDGGVIWLLLRQVLTMAVVGAGVGLGGAFVGGRAVRAQLYGVGAHDPAVLASVVGVLLAVALIAALGPARRALRAEPSDVMREE
jgi:ABC-type antimicrobial peptide transport system permease subunit